MTRNVAECRPWIHEFQGRSLSHCGGIGREQRGFVGSRVSLDAGKEGSEYCGGHGPSTPKPEGDTGSTKDVAHPPPIGATGQQQVPPPSLETASGTEDAEALSEGNVSPVIDTRALCAELGQSVRFANGRIAIYDTDERREIRDELTKRLLSSSADTPHQVVLTGMGGTGKSHNLAYWVQQQREAGHMVVYVNDMQDWIEGGDKYIFKEIEFGLCNWKYWSDDIASVDDVSTLSVKHPWLKTPDGLDLQRRLDISVAKMKELQCVGPTVYTLNPVVWLDTLRRVVDAANDSGASSRVGGETKPRLLFVVDQDNRLHKMWKESDYPSLSNHPEAYHINRVITTNNAHLTVASASANNEGWERRGWADTLVQSAHGLEPQDADSMIKGLLAPLNLYSKAISARIQEETANSPLDIKLLCQRCAAVASEHYKLVKMSGIGVGIDEARHLWGWLPRLPRLPTKCAFSGTDRQSLGLRQPCKSLTRGLLRHAWIVSMSPLSWICFAGVCSASLLTIGPMGSQPPSNTFCFLYH